ncbi:MAG: NDP-sugar synthase [Actinobacteria bacterium]|nr:NDP-sugar synthase [Actinomycetota bacterium]
MKAVVLVGGEGTRLRPLTETTPKPLVPLMDRASLDFVLDHLATHGVLQVVLSSPHLESTFHPFIEARHGRPEIAWVTESEPLGTGGAIVNALDRLTPGEPFFALNGDILTDLDLTAMLAFHRERGAVATIALHRVSDARPFGLVPTEADGRVREFLEKPSDPVPGDINAGTYVLEPEALAGWKPGVNVSIERDIFPAVIASGRPVFGFVSEAYWLDLGTPEKYLQAHFDMMEGKVHGVVYPSPYLGAGAEVDPRAHLGRRVVLGPGARVGAEARVEDSVLHRGAVVGARALVAGSILGPSSEVGQGATVTGSVLGEGARVLAGQTAADARVPSSS